MGTKLRRASSHKIDNEQLTIEKWVCPIHETGVIFKASIVSVKDTKFCNVFFGGICVKSIKSV